MLSQVEHRFLKLVDLTELLRLLSELLECCLPEQRDIYLSECLVLAESVADQTDLVAELGVILYLQDTFATRLSTYGSILHKVSRLLVLIGIHV